MSRYVSYQDLTLESRPKLRPSTVRTVLADTPCLLDQSTGSLMVLAPHLDIALQFLDGQTTLGELATDVAEAFEAPLDQVETDLLETAKHLGSRGLLAGVEPLPRDWLDGMVPPAQAPEPKPVTARRFLDFAPNT